jgi:hypothetical protein
MNTAGGTIDDEWMTLTRCGLMPLCAGFLPCYDQVSRGWRFANFSSLLYIFSHSSAYITLRTRANAPGAASTCIFFLTRQGMYVTNFSS